MSYRNVRLHERGAVSLFIVVFTALLVAIVTVSFVQLMTRNQQQATQSDLSQSAYDSALAGVEDAKRVLILNKKCMNGAIADPAYCTKIDQALTSESCDAIGKVFGTDGSGETKIQQSENDARLDQAYTCVKILRDTLNYQRKGLSMGKSHIVPLRTVPGETFNQVEVKWFTNADAKINGGTDDAGAANLTFPTPGLPALPRDATSSGWSQSAPPLLRAQFIRTNANFNLSDLDGKSNAATLFLYPSAVGLSNYNFNDDPRDTGDAAPNPVVCSRDVFKKGGYACSVTLTLPSAVDESSAAYLRLGAIYTTTRYQLVLKNDGRVMKFYNVQPEIDATGRASDQFRRVKARIQLDAEFPYPESALDLNGSLCKDFSVTSRDSDYKPGRCVPAATAN